MNYTLSWLTEHIKGGIASLSIEKVINAIEKSICEVEEIVEISLPLSDLTLIEVTSCENDIILASSKELDRVFTFPVREDASLLDCFLIRKENNTWRWATAKDCGGIKENFLPKLLVDKEDLSGAWKERYKISDYKIILDNKSIGHRPDLWGHRGLAREIAAILNLEIISDEYFLEKVETIHYNSSIKPCIQNKAASFLSIILLNNTYNKPSPLDWAIRLSQVDVKTHNAIVDATNYTMFDYGHPLHAFDKKNISGKELIVRYAGNTEKLHVLDGTTIELTENDIIVSDTEKPLSLAGCMGGVESSVSKTTNSLILEAAVFDAETIRKTSQRLLKRTDSAIRFEKGLTSYGALCALRRCLHLLCQKKIIESFEAIVLYDGKLPENREITVKYSKILNILGIEHISPETIQSLLHSIGFTTFTLENEQGIFFKIIIPSWRSIKDISCDQDIIEEIGRLYGYNLIKQVPSVKEQKGFCLKKIRSKRLIKKNAVSFLQAHEVVSYGILDIQTAKNFFIENDLIIENSQRQLTSSTIPGIFPYALAAARNHKENIFFEISSVWNIHENEILENDMCSFISVSNTEIHRNFFEQKNIFNKFFKSLGIDFVEWRPEASIPKYFSHYSAALYIDDTLLGYAGYLEQSIVAGIPASFFACECKYDILAKYHELSNEITSEENVSFFDISFYQSFEQELSEIINHFKNKIKNVKNVKIIDFFDKTNNNLRSVTFRFSFLDKKDSLFIEKQVKEVAHANGLIAR